MNEENSMVLGEQYDDPDYAPADHFDEDALVDEELQRWADERQENVDRAMSDFFGLVKDIARMQHPLSAIPTVYDWEVSAIKRELKR